MVEYQRVDLGPNRWMAAGGQAFLHVHAKRGLFVSVTLIPVGDVTVRQSVVFESPRSDVFAAIGLLCPVPGLIVQALNGSYLGFLMWLVSLGLCFGIVAILWYRRRNGLMLLYVSGTFDTPSRIDFGLAQVRRPEFNEFLQHLESLSKSRGRGRGTVHEYALHACWMTVIAVIAATAIFTGLLPLFWTGLTIPHAVVGALILVAVAFLFSSDRQLIGHRELRRAHAYLLRKEPDAAVEVLQSFLQRNPSHACAFKLLTIAELMRCNMDVAEKVIVQRDEFDPWRRSRLMRAFYYKHWESRHGEH